MPAASLPGVTPKQLSSRSGAKLGHIYYWGKRGYLPILFPSKGPGSPVIYDEKAIAIAKRLVKESNRIGRY